MTGLVKTKDVMAALDKPRKSVLERAQAEGWPCVQKSGGMLQWIENRLPMDVRLALACREAPVPAPVAEEAKRQAEAALAGNVFARASEKAREVAAWRSALIAAWKTSGLRKDEFLEAYNGRLTAKALYDKLGPVSLPNFYRWLKAFNESGPSGLTPMYGMCARGSGATLTETERDLLRYYWLKDTQPSKRHAYRLMRINVPYSQCTYETAARYLGEIPPVVRDFYRLGRTRFTNAHMPHMQQNVWKYRSMDVVVSDHHCLDSVIMYQGRIIRPWITTMQDYRSGKILGWAPSVKPSSYSIILAYYMAVIQYGIPKKLLFDNGQDYRSTLLNGSTEKVTVLTPDGIEEEQEIYIQGLFSLIGSDVHFTQVYNGKSKGRQERFFRTLGEYLAKDLGGYVGSDSRSRPEDSQLYFRPLNGRARRYDLPDWNAFVDSTHKMLQLINDTFESEGKGMDGKTPSQVFAENLPGDVRKADKETLRLALSRGEVRGVRKSVVRVDGIDYYHPDLFRYSGQQVIVRRGLTNGNEVLVCTLKGETIGTAVGSYFLEGEDLEESTAKLRKAQKNNLRMLSEMGSNEVQAAPEYETMTQVAANLYKQNEILDVDEYLALPKAVGAEEIAQDRPKATKRRELKSPLDATLEDYK